MNLRIHHAVVAAVIVAASAPLGAQQQSVEYDISFPNAEQHEARVAATFRGVPPGKQFRMRMSRASPGRFRRYVTGREAPDFERLRIIPVTLREPNDVQVLTYEKAGLALTPAMRARRAEWLASRVKR